MEPSFDGFILLADRIVYISKPVSNVVVKKMCS